MKKTLKKLLCLITAITLMFGFVPTAAITSHAASAKKLTLYTGEAVYVTDYYDVKSCSSSKKNVVSVKRDSQNKKHANIIAKKAGKATVTVKTANKTSKYVITVKDTSKQFNCSMSYITNGSSKSILLKAANKSTQAFDTVEVRYTLKDSSGTVLNEDSTKIYSVAMKKSGYTEIIYDRNLEVDLNQSYAEAVAVDRNLNKKSVDLTKQVNVKHSGDPIASGSSTELDVTLTSKNKNKNISANVVNYIFIYDSSDTLIYFTKRSAYLKGGATDTTVSKSYLSSQATYDHYKVETTAYGYK
ncbi:MAG: hypothetical protein K6F00_01800 [Lachnospiraceae bacterium]|nr:hypothetical protein [Lachnospiraceae bacterium]